MNVPDSETIDEWQNTAGQLDELKEAAAKNRLSDDELEKLEWYKKRFAEEFPMKTKSGRFMISGFQHRTSRILLLARK
ncbi:MAG: hypothetical protein ACLS9K_06050 [Lachnospira eligens]